MKTINTVLILVAVSHTVFAQTLELESNLVFARPTGAMSGNMNNAFGITFAGGKQFKSPFSLGMELSFANYGYETSRQQYTFDDGSVTETNVNVGNNIFNLHLTGKHFLRKNKNINPYLSAKAGWTWFTTNLTIEDPADEFSCHPIESDIISRDNTYAVSGGAGVRLNFRKDNTEAGRLYLDLNVHSTHGGIVRYMNVEMDPKQPVPDQDIMATFVNTQSQVVHEHHVGYVYSGVLSMLEYRLGLVWSPGF